MRIVRPLHVHQLLEEFTYVCVLHLEVELRKLNRYVLDANNVSSSMRTPRGVRRTLHLYDERTTYVHNASITSAPYVCVLHLEVELINRYVDVESLRSK